MLKFRNFGAIGALLDEYEKAIDELNNLISGISADELVKVVDSKTKDSNCVSIQSILTHVEQACYNYIIEMRISLGEQCDYSGKVYRNSCEDYSRALCLAFQSNEIFIADYPNLILEEHDESKKIKVRWGQKYDFEQLFEHAIVHILRHRRQIHRFLLKIRS